MRRRHGDRAEAAASAYLRERGWTIVASQLRVGRDEIDLLAIEPGSPQAIVAVEVRSRSGPAFGLQEERVDAGKVRRLYRAVGALRAAGRLPDGTELPHRTWRVDLLAIDLAPDPTATDATDVLAIRHLRGVIPR